MWCNSVRLLLLFSYGCRICRYYIDIPSVHGTARRNYRRIATVTSTTTTTTKVLHYYYYCCYYYYNNYCSDGGYKKNVKSLTHTLGNFAFNTIQFLVRANNILSYSTAVDDGWRRCSCVLVWEITAASSVLWICDTLIW